MPFSIKATYHGQMRKLRPYQYGFPTWDQLVAHVHQVFSNVGPIGIVNTRVYDRFDASIITLGDDTPIGDSATFDLVIRPFFARNARRLRSLVMKFDVVDITPASASTEAPVPVNNPAPVPAESSSEPETVKTATAQSVSDQTRVDLRNIRDIAQKFLADFARAAAPFEIDEDEGSTVIQPSPSAQPAPRALATAFVPTTFSSNTPSQIICDGCDSFIFDKRYKCTTCPNFDFCEECFTLNKSRFGTYGHPHTFKLASLPFRPSNQSSSQTAAAASLRSHNHAAASAQGITSAADGVLHNAYCNACFRTIRGVRHKCVVCDDYDLCDRCISSRGAVHREDHDFVALREPGDVVVWSTNRDDEDAENKPDIIPAFKMPAPPSSAPVVHHATCDICDERIVGIRYKCLDCDDYDLCESCIGHRYELHLPLHTFLSIDRTTKLIIHRSHERESHQAAAPEPIVSEAAPVPAPAAAPAASTSAHDEPSVVNAHPATCDLCASKIHGARYKCAECPDYDTCEACFSITEEQHPGHSFIRIRDASDFINRDVSHLRHLPSHFARCNACNEEIAPYSPRFKCTHPSCPDFDLCANCEALPHPAHPVEHAMLKLRVPASMIEPKESLPHEREDVVPVAHAAICDFCDNDIIGVRYKCAQCDDFDLCQACESIPNSHPESHVLMKIKTLQEPRLVLASRREVAQSRQQTQPEHNEPAAVVSNGSEDAAARVPKEMIERPSAQPVSVEVRSIPVAAAEPSALEAPTPNPFEDPLEMKLDGHFIEDLSIPDGHPMPPNSHFIKRWRLFNPGPQDWPARTQLRFTGGDSMGAPEQVHVGAVETGHGVVVEVAMQAASAEGKQLGFWSLACDENLFGHRLWVEIEVVDTMEKSFVGTGSGSSLKSSAIVMPSAPSAAGSPVALRADETVPEINTIVGQVDDEIEESSHAVSSNVSVVSLSEVSEDEWDAAARVVEHGVIAEDNREIEEGWDAVADTLDREAREHGMYVDAAGEEALRDRNGYVLVYDGYDSSDSD